MTETGAFDLCARYRQIVETSPYITTILAADGTVQFASGAIERLLGFAPAECIGRNFLDFVHPDGIELAVTAFTEAATRADADTAAAGAPIVVALQNAAGAPLLFEVGSIPRLDDPAVRGVIVRARPVPSHGLLDDYLAALTAGAPLAEAFRPLIDALSLEIPAARGGIAFDWNGRAFMSGTSSGLPDVLFGLGRADVADPWSLARTTGEPVLHTTTDHLRRAVRDAAATNGLRACFVYPIKHPDGTVEGSLVVWRTVAGPPWVSHGLTVERTIRLAAIAFERHRVEAQLVHATLHDPLTGIANRVNFFRRLAHLGIAAGDRRGTAVLYLDLDDFKSVNDRYGHLAGDQLLIEVAHRIQHELRPDDLVARLGGDEFAVVCPGLADPAEAESIAKRLVAAVNHPVVINGQDVRVSLSIGIAYDRDARDVDDLVDGADAAMRAAKQGGKGAWGVEPAPS